MGRNQGVVLSPLKSKPPSITGDVEPPAGACQKNDHDLQQAFLDKLKESLMP